MKTNYHLESLRQWHERLERTDDLSNEEISVYDFKMLIWLVYNALKEEENDH